MWADSYPHEVNGSGCGGREGVEVHIMNHPVKSCLVQQFLLRINKRARTQKNIHKCIMTTLIYFRPNKRT